MLLSKPDVRKTTYSCQAIKLKLSTYVSEKVEKLISEGKKKQLLSEEDLKHRMNCI